jgi:hypothetical protein
MKLDALLSTIILVSFLVTIMMAVGSYFAYKLREARRPHAAEAHHQIAAGESPFFETLSADELDAPGRAPHG